MLKTKTVRNTDRKALVKRNGFWKEIPFTKIQKGDKFQLFEANGKQVFNHKNEHVYIATGKPYFCSELEALIVEVKE